MVKRRTIRAVALRGVISVTDDKIACLASSGSCSIRGLGDVARIRPLDLVYNVYIHVSKNNRGREDEIEVESCCLTRRLTQN